jgi:cellobiose transport system permease protein
LLPERSLPLNLRKKVGNAMSADPNIINTQFTKGTKGNLKKAGMEKFKRHSWPYVFLAPFFIFYGVFNLFPVLYTFIISLTNWDALFLNQKKFVGFANYIHLFTADPYFYKSLLNTIGFMIGYIPIIMLLGLFLAVVLFNLPFCKRLFQTLNLLPYITTPVAIGFIFSFMFDYANGMVNNVLTALHIIPEGINWLGLGKIAPFIVVLMIFWKNLGYYLIIYLAGLTGIPMEINEAAIVDGASQRQIFFHITLPFLKPITVFLLVTSIIGGFQLFDEPFLLFNGGLSGNGLKIVGGPERSCLTTVWYFYDVAFRSTSKLGYGAAVSYGLFLFILVFSLLGLKILNRKEEQV